VSWQIGVTRNAALLAAAPDPGQLRNTLGLAVQEWKNYSATHPDAFGLIVILDSDTYAKDLTGANALDVPAGAALAVVAADWPVRTGPDGVPSRAVGDYVPTGLRPHLQGNVEAHGVPGAVPGELTIDGLLVEGHLTVLAGQLGALRLGHVTLAPATAAAPDRGRVAVAPSADPATQNTALAVTIQSAIVGFVDLADAVPALNVTDSIVASGADGSAGGPAVVADGADVVIDTSTVFGDVHVRRLDASNSLFTGLVTAVRRQAGCVRFCYVRDDSPTGRRYRCQPDLALDADKDPAHAASIRLRVRPTFTTDNFGLPGYAQLALGCAAEVRTGADDGSEMGAFHGLMAPQRESNLRSSLDEYLRFGLEAGLFFVS
jgi:hypothetical protein